MMNAIYHGARTVLPVGQFLRQCVVVYDPFPTVRRTVAGTEFVVTGRHSPRARETATAKMRRLILAAQV